MFSRHGIKAGTRVRLVNPFFKVSIEGTLTQDVEYPRWQNAHTIRLDDGRMYRNEGRLEKITDPRIPE